MSQQQEVPHYQLYIGGEWTAPQPEAYSALIEPASAAILGYAAQASSSDVDRAVQAARQAFDRGPWPHTPPVERVRILHAIADLIEQHTDELALLETRNGGSTLRKTSFVDIPFAVESVRAIAEMARRHPYEPLPWNDMPSLSWSFVWREPVGVCAQIIPWNFPFVMAIWKLAPALACGNTLVLKPASYTPLSALRLFELIHQSGLLPRGVINLITGSGQLAGEALIAHPGVDKVAFTGSTEVGRRVMQLAAQTLKDVTLELGGKSPSIILPDADLDETIDGVLFGAFLHNGQICQAGSRCFVPQTRYDEVLQRLVDRTSRLVIGDPLDLASDLGPLVHQSQCRSVEEYIAIGKREGARLLCGGARPANPELAGLPYLLPTIFADVQNGMRLAQEEIFGPLLAVIPYHSVADAISMANQSRYGLAASVWGRDIRAAIEVARRVQSGVVWVNDYHTINIQAPFGGWKQSGIGTELGISGLQSYTRQKYIHVDLTAKRQDKIWWDSLLIQEQGQTGI